MPEPSLIASFPASAPEQGRVVFVRDELMRILDLYGRMVARGEWRDYGIQLGRHEAVFSIFRRASEMPIYRIVKRPDRAGRQGAWSLLGMDGRVLKRGADLRLVLAPLERKWLRLSS